MNDFEPGPIFLGLLVVFGFALLPAIFFFLTQQNTLKNVRVQNRTLSPGQVWLQLIPIFNIIWQFIVVNRIAESIERELRAENQFSFEQEQPDTGYAAEKPTYGIGMAYCILSVCSFVPILGTFAAIASIVCWIIYWVKLADYKRRLEGMRYRQATQVY